MNITPEQIALLRRSYDRLTPELSSVSADFYEDLFRTHPRIRDLFQMDMHQQGMRFMSAIGLIVEHLDNPTELDRHLRMVAARHVGMDIQPADYAAMQVALIDTFRHAMGHSFTPSMEGAWKVTLRQVCDVMQGHERDAA